MNVDFKDLNVAVFYGGWSNEREVSIRSGLKVLNALKKRKYNVIGYDIKRETLLDIIYNKPIDIVFLMTHGKWGEDGSIQGLLDSLGILYTGSDVTSSALCMDKIFTKLIFNELNLPTPSYTIISRKENNIRLDDYPYIIKPRREGSSVGIEIIYNENELNNYLKNNDSFHPKFLLEKYIKGIELTCGIIGTEDNAEALPLLEIQPKNEFYDYEAKYTKGMTDFIVPAQIPADVAKKVTKLSIRAYREMECRDFGRVDSIIDSNNDIYLLEINTLPGMTNISDLPIEAKAKNVSYDELVETILLSALKRRRQ